MNPTTEPALEHDRVTVDDIELHVVRAGPADGTPVLLLHGFPEFWYGWRRQIGPLAAAGCRVIVPDLRGYNLSSRPRGSRQYTPERLQRDVLALLDHERLAQASIVGHDWGGLLGWWLAIHHPQRVARLAVLNAPHPQVFRDHLRRHPGQLLRSAYLLFFQLPVLPETLLRTGDYFWLRKGLQWTSRRDAFSTADLARYREAWAQPGALTGMLAWYRGLRHLPPTAAPLPVEKPVLIIWGERDFALARRLADDSLAQCTAGRLELLPQASHWVQHEEPATVNRLLLAFLD